MSDKKRKILIIEDEDILANILFIKLTKAGYETIVLQDGEAGLEAIRREDPDLVLLDIMLPKKNGYEVLEILKQEEKVPALPVIVISNSGEKVEFDRMLQLGARKVLVKVNFDPNEVLACVREIFNSNQEPLMNNVTQKTHKNVSKKTEQTEQAEKKYSVLVVEDDLFIAELEVGKLKRTFNVYLATNTAKAFEILHKYHIDIICLDIVLPDQNGLSFLKELKQIEKIKNIPVIIFSNLSQKDEIQKALDVGAVDYLIKANTMPEEITKRIIHILGDDEKAK